MTEIKILAALLAATILVSWWAYLRTSDLPRETRRPSVPPLHDIVGIPISLTNRYGATIDQSDVADLAQAGYKTVIRLNGDSPARERGYMSIRQEKAACTANDMRFYYFNIEGKDGLNMENVETIRDLLNEGKVFIHCRNGAHRAPAMAAYWLKMEHDMPKDDIIYLVGWDGLYPTPGGYKRYTDVLDIK